MINKQGKSIQDRLHEDIEYAENLDDISHKKILATKALGAVDLAVEFEMITYTEWEEYISKIFEMI